jgi:hypothetical protein
LGFEQRSLDFLELLGLVSLFEVKKLTKRQAQAQFGAEGLRLYELLHPPKIEYAVPCWHNQSCTAGIDISWECDLHQCRAVLGKLIQSILAQQDSIVHLSLKINNDTSLYARHSFKQPTRDASLLHRCSIALVSELADKAESIHRIEITAQLQNTPPVQGDLWRKPQWEQLRSTLTRRFPHQVFRPRIHSDFFLPEQAYSLALLADG